MKRYNIARQKAAVATIKADYLLEKKNNQLFEIKKGDREKN
jgi:hypothetical protein